MRMATVEGCFTVAFMNWTAGSALTGYLLHYGAGPHALALVASIPALVQLINPLVAWFSQRLGRRLPFIIVSTFLGRSLWLLPVALPFLDLAPPQAVYFLVAVVAASSLIQSPAGPPWISLMADAVPERVRGRYFGLRNAIVGVVSQAVGLAGGALLDRLPEPLGFQVVMAVAVLFAWTGVHLYTRYHEPVVVRPRVGFTDSLLAPLRDPVFRRFLVFSTYWSASVWIGSPFVIPYFLKNLQMTYTQIAIWSAIGSVCALATSPLWGRIADRAGNKSVLAITTVLAGTVYPFCWMFATPGHLELIWFSGLVNALSWGGINAAMFNLAIRIAPPDLRTSYMAVAGGINGLCGFVSGLASGPLLDLLLPWETTVFGFPWTGYHWLFLLTALLRSTAWLLLRGVTEPQAWRTRDLLRALRTRSLDYLGRVWPLRAD
jgi:MFS family permease